MKGTFRMLSRKSRLPFVGGRHYDDRQRKAPGVFRNIPSIIFGVFRNIPLIIFDLYQVRQKFAEVHYGISGTLVLNIATVDLFRPGYLLADSIVGLPLIRCPPNVIEQTEKRNFKYLYKNMDNIRRIRFPIHIVKHSDTFGDR